MRIVIDGRLWGETGIGRYIRNLVSNLQRIDRTNRYCILLLKKDFQKLKFTDNFEKTLADFHWYGVGEQIKLPKLLNNLNPDLVHFPHFNVPIFYHGEFVVTIHDLIHQHFQMYRATTHGPLTYALKKLGYEKVFSHAVNQARNILTPSNFVKKQLLERYKFENNKIEVTYEGVETSFVALMRQVRKQDIEKILGKYKIKSPYIFYVGNAHPHKNLPRLIRAFMKVKEKFPDYQLVLSGPDHYFWNKIKKNVSNPRGLIFTGFVTDEELVTLYKNAQAFIMPSLEEGFGIPVLEAMVCSCPVVSSDAASLPEVGGKAVVYFDPEKEEDMFRKIAGVLSDEKLRRELIQKGQERYKQFSWQQLAEKTLKIYTKNA